MLHSKVKSPDRCRWKLARSCTTKVLDHWLEPMAHDFARPFGFRSERGYDHAAVGRFPWPIIAVYDDVHRWMDQGLIVHAAWQLRDTWEALIKFLGTLAVADHLASVPPEDPRNSKLLARLLAKPLSLGDWPRLIELSLKGGSPSKARLPGLGPLLFRKRKATRLYEMLDGNRESFVPWRNRRFGHGVLGKDLTELAQETKTWLEWLHEAYNLCREFFQTLELQSDGPDGKMLTWREKPPLPFYHEHQPAEEPVLLVMRIGTRGQTEKIALTPMLSGQRCSVCQNWAAFYFDGYDDKKHRAYFLDFYFGHHQERAKVETILRLYNQVEPDDLAKVRSQPVDPTEQREPNPGRFRDFDSAFEPLTYLARKVAEFLSRHDRGVIWLYGPSGVGKSWACRGLDRESMLPAMLGHKVELLHVTVHEAEPSSADEILYEFREHARRIKHWQTPQEAAVTGHARLTQWLQLLMQANIACRGQLLVVLDGLDELLADSDVPDLLPSAQELPVGCYLVLGSRPTLRLAAAKGLRRALSAGPSLEIELNPHDCEHQSVLHSYVSKQLAKPRGDGSRLPADWIERLIEQAGGNFLYLFHYCQALQHGHYRELTQLPTPAEYYPAFFAHLTAYVGQELFEQFYSRTLALIAVAREPVGLSHLTGWGLERGRLVAVLDDLADLLASRRQPRDPETLYTLGHDAIRQFLTSDGVWQGRLARANHFLAEQAVQRFGADWTKVDPFDPVESYLLLHVLDHADGELIGRLLTDIALADAISVHAEAMSARTFWDRVRLAAANAVRLRTRQVADGRTELRSCLANAHGNLGLALYCTGQAHEALGPSEASLVLLRDLVTSAGRGDLCSDLARAYMIHGLVLVAIGREQQALAAYDAAIKLLAQRTAEPERCADLGRAYLNRSAVRSNPNRLQDANTCLELLEPLVREEDDKRFWPSLTRAHLNRANILLTLGDYESARKEYEDSIEDLQTMIRSEGHSVLVPELATAHIDAALSYQELERIPEALRHFSLAVDLLRELVEQDGFSQFRSELARGLIDRGQASQTLSRLPEARANLEEGVNLMRQVAAQGDRGSHTVQLARGIAMMAQVFLALGERPKARQQAEEAVQILQAELKSQNPAATSMLLDFAKRVLRDANRTPIAERIVAFPWRAIWRIISVLVQKP